MSTTITVKAKGLETLVIENSPYDTSAYGLEIYIVKETQDKSADDSHVHLIGSIENGELPNVEIELPFFLDDVEVRPGATYPAEIIANKAGDNPIVLASHRDLYLKIEDVKSLR